MGRKSIFINEDKLDVLGNKKKYLLPKFLFTQLESHHTSLGNNPAFPPEKDHEFDYAIIKKRYKEVVDEVVKEFGEEILPLESSERTISLLLRRCKDAERPIRQQLEKIAYNAINRLFAIPEEVINYSCKLVDKIKYDEGIRITPESAEDEAEYEFDDVNDILKSSEVIAKRRVIDALIQGGAYELGKNSELFANEINDINPELMKLYNKIMILNDYLLFIKKEKMTDDKPQQGAFVSVKLGGVGERTNIEAQGLIFPLMYNELIRGFLEQFSSFGLPQDTKKRNYIIRKADFILAEPWDMRFGSYLWKKIMPDDIHSNAIPYYFKTICQLDTEEFNNNLKEVFAGTHRGTDFKNALLDDINHNIDYQHFVNNINAKNVDKSLINDGYFSAAELDSFMLDGDDDMPEEEILTDDIDNEEAEETLSENTEEEGFSTPDTAYVNDETVNWGDVDAIPFFVLKDWSIEFGKPKQTHQKYYSEKYGQDKVTLNKFLNSIVLQGRYWKDKNILSFWAIDNEGYTNELLRYVVTQICDLKRPCYIAYKDKVSQVIKEKDGFIWFKPIPQDNGKEEIDDKTWQEMNQKWDDTKRFIENCYVIRDNSGNKFFDRPLTKYDVFACTCHQYWADYVRNKHFSYAQVEIFIAKRYHYKLSFKEGLNYFSKNLRNRAWGKNMNNIPDGKGYESEGNIEDMLNSLGVNRSQYTVIYYDRTNKPYSYNIHITDKEQAQAIIDAAKANDLIVDRVNSRQIGDRHEYMYTLRLRNKA